MKKLVILPHHNDEIYHVTSFCMNKRSIKRIILAMGSNTTREQSMARAMTMIEKEMGKMTFTPTIESDAIGMVAEPFINCLAYGESDMTVREITMILKQIEHACGNNAELRSQNKIVIDLDLLLWGNKRYHSSDWNRHYVKELLKMVPEAFLHQSQNAEETKR